MLSLGDAGSQLLAEQTKLSPTDKVLILSADDPILILNIAKQVASVDVYDSSYTALQRAHERVNSRAADSTPVSFSAEVFPRAGSERPYDVALMIVPKGRDFARAQLWSAFRTLRSGGRLYIAGPTQGGAKSVIADAAELFGHGVTLASRRRYRVGVAIRPDSTPLYPWGDDPTTIQQRSIEVNGQAITLATMPGIFSWEHLDDGTAFLLENLEIEPGQTVLDVGAGYGIIGLTLAPQAKSVTLTDDNLLALRTAQANVELNGLQNVSIEPSDVYSALKGRKFDLIVSNPPF